LYKNNAPTARQRGARGADTISFSSDSSPIPVRQHERIFKDEITAALLDNQPCCAGVIARLIFLRPGFGTPA